MQELPYGGWVAPNIYYLGGDQQTVNVIIPSTCLSILRHDLNLFSQVTLVLFASKGSELVAHLESSNHMTTEGVRFFFDCLKLHTQIPMKQFVFFVKCINSSRPGCQESPNALTLDNQEVTAAVDSRLNRNNCVYQREAATLDRRTLCIYRRSYASKLFFCFHNVSFQKGEIENIDQFGVSWCRRAVR